MHFKIRLGGINMGDNVIEVRNLGKKYIIRHQQERYGSLRDTIANKTKEIIHPGSKQHINKEEFWALQDINFDIKQGDRVGIIGRNGAGKSTLLKLLSRITEPTTGSIKIRGRVASLLEVGTGFHPELTGRENIYLNGAILGMSKVEIHKKFDEIVEFAGVEKFLDTPVKRYSSGMYVRLAFSVAANLDSEVLIVDEVLAVGDSEFQAKCLGKMDESASSGKTVLFVSHSMEAIEKLCTSGVILDNGKVLNKGNDINMIIRQYLKEGETRKAVWKLQNCTKNEYFVPYRMRVIDTRQRIIEEPILGLERAYLEIEGEILQIHPSLVIGYYLYDSRGTAIYSTFLNEGLNEKKIQFHKGNIKLKTEIPINILKEGDYRIELEVVLHQIKYLIQPGKNAPIINIRVQGSNSKSSLIIPNKVGVIRPILEWNII